MEYLVGGIAVSVSTLTVFAYLIFIWWLDRYEREPFWLVLLTFLYGGLFGTLLGCTISAVPGGIAVALCGAEAGNFLGATVVAPIVEEATKGGIFVLLVLSRHFDNETDGLIYGAATGLGFACVENLLYFASAENVEMLVGMAVLRTLFTAIVHCVSSATLGMAFGFARHRRGLLRAAIVVSLGYMLAVTNHAIWNALASVSGFAGLEEAGAAFLLIGCGLVVLAAFVMFGLTQLSLKREHDLIKRYLAEEAARGTIPAAHADVIPYWLKRRRRDWLKPGVDRAAYIENATLLAFRQYQLTHAEGAKRQRLLEEIEQRRAEVRRLLA